MSGKFPTTLLALAVAAAHPAPAADDLDRAVYRDEVLAWRAKAEESLKRDNGWLTLAGRYALKPGANRIGTAADNDIVFPAGTGPDHLGTLTVADGKAQLDAAPGVTMLAKGTPFTTREMAPDAGNERDWVTVGRLAMHVIARNGNLILRLADNQSEVRRQFTGRVWYEIKDPFRAVGRFVPYSPPRHVPIVNVLGEVSDELAAGAVRFTLAGREYSLDAFEEDDELFLIFRDPTAGRTTYPAGRFLTARKSADGQVILDFNKAYNPPCAFSEFTTCPLPPRQNHLTVAIEAGERHLAKRQ